MTPIDILIIGGSGFIGARTAVLAQQSGQSVVCTHLHRPVPPGITAYPLTTDNEDAVRACLAETQPRAVIYCAIAWNLNSETEQMQVSLEGLRNVIRGLTAECTPQTRLVYISTNAVFSGQHGPYTEHDLPDPQNRTDAYRFYGAGRRSGEIFALANWENTLVARTANVDGKDAWGKLNPRLLSLVEPLLAGNTISRYVDRSISPTLVDNLAQALVEVSQSSFSLPSNPDDRILHLAGREPMTDFVYAQHLAARLHLPTERILPDHLLPVGASEHYSIGLDVSYTQSLLHTKLLDVDEMLAVVFPEP